MCLLLLLLFLHVLLWLAVLVGGFLVFLPLFNIRSSVTVAGKRRGRRRAVLYSMSMYGRPCQKTHTHKQRREARA